MIEPSINSLLERLTVGILWWWLPPREPDSLRTVANKLTNCESDKPVTVAINEINENKITYIRTKSGIK